MTTKKVDIIALTRLNLAGGVVQPGEKCKVAEDAAEILIAKGYAKAAPKKAKKAD